MAKTKKEEHHFLIQTHRGCYLMLNALPGQFLKNRELSTRVMVRGHESYRKSFPEGSVFGTTTLKEAHKGLAGYYEVKDLYCLGDCDPNANLIDEPVRQMLITEFSEFLDRWFSQTDFETMEKIFSLRHKKFNKEDGYQAFVDECERRWKEFSCSEKYKRYKQFNL